jgi:hypothetical protein
LPTAGQPGLRDGGGAAACWITAVGTEVEELPPSELAAVTRRRSVAPTSAEVNRYEPERAPLIEEQLLPFRSQRYQTNAYAVGECVQLPFDPVSVAPSAGVPEIVGGVLFAGAAAARTTAVGLELALSEPDAFRARTRKRIVLPTSSPPRV